MLEKRVYLGHTVPAKKQHCVPITLWIWLMRFPQDTWIGIVGNAQEKLGAEIDQHAA